MCNALKFQGVSGRDCHAERHVKRRYENTVKSRYESRLSAMEQTMEDPMCCLSYYENPQCLVA